MVVSCFPTGIVNLRYPGQGIMDLSHAGFTNLLLDMSLCCPAGDFEVLGMKKKVGHRKLHDAISIMENPAALSGCLEKFIHEAGKCQIPISAAHAPYLLRNTKRTDLQETLERIMEESIRLCGEIGCQYLVVRPLFAGVRYDDEWQVNRKYYLRLEAVARECNIILLLENQCRDMGGHLVRGICSDAHTAAEWIDRLNVECGEERFGFCMDSGACNLCGQNMYEMALTLGKRLKMVILRDCDGHRESSMLPFTCAFRGKSQTDWLSLIRGLREIEFDGILALNMTDTTAAFSPLLRPQLLAMAKSVADYFKWQIGIESFLKKYDKRVLFGAGNMCRNYMKCYGEKYPPLFTCDNNKALWGTSFCGLEVKPPEALKELSPDCAIFLCNIFYREIEKQLRDMGIRNPIEFFNDEYMPSFYFDRVVRND